MNESRPLSVSVSHGQDSILNSVIQELHSLRDQILSAVESSLFDLTVLKSEQRLSACNLIHYLSLRRKDIHKLQQQLADLGLSSLGRSEAHVLATIDAVLTALYQLTGENSDDRLDVAVFPDFQQGRQLLVEHSKRLLGTRPADRDAHIMVTMPTEAAEDYELVLNLLRSGMDCMRINCAHDSPGIWLGMIENLRRAEQEVGITCKVSMDLAGPKLRTVFHTADVPVIKIKPQRDKLGQILRPARVLLSMSGTEDLSADAVIIVDRQFLDKVEIGDVLHVVDARSAKRRFTVIEKSEAHCLVELKKTAYITCDTRFDCYRQNDSVGQFSVARLVDRDPVILLCVNDHLLLTDNLQRARASEFFQQSAGVIECSLPLILSQIKAGESVWFDDGKIGGQVESIIDGDLFIRITHAGETGSKLRPDKGINFPSSKLNLPALTEKDLLDLGFVAAQADIVALSFVNTVDDVRALIARLTELKRTDVSVLLKIETVSGFIHLPAMLLEAMKVDSCGVMIARGDLAIEIGFERLAEVQEEILWVCEAAHVPVVWATQVLDNLAKHGIPTRAEISDASMANRADCVMLNKGPYIVDAVNTLADILRRMQFHQSKKQSIMRELSLADSFFH